MNISGIEFEEKCNQGCVKVSMAQDLTEEIAYEYLNRENAIEAIKYLADQFNIGLDEIKESDYELI